MCPNLNNIYLTYIRFLLGYTHLYPSIDFLMYQLIGVVEQFWTLKLFYQLHIAFMEIVKKVA